MKKILLSAVAFIAAVSLNAQTNLIQGGSMEKADSAKWDTSSLNNAPNVGEFAFGYTNVPTGGTGGSLHVTVSNPGGVGSGLMFYQAVTLKKGSKYLFNFAVKTLQPMQNSWLEVYVGPEPELGADYGTSNGSKALGGFKWTGWETGCAETGDEFDGTLQEIGCLPGSQDTLSYEGTGDTTVYIGFKMGIWDFNTTIEFVFDNVSLTEISGGTAVKSVYKANSIVANINNQLLSISNLNAGKVSLFNVTGQKVKSTYVNSSEASFNVADLPSGIYIIQNGNNSLKIIK